MIRKSVLPIILLGLLMPTLVLAANQSFDVSFIDPDPAVNGLNDVGSLVITEGPHHFNDFKDFTVMRGDEIQWHGDGQIYLYEVGSYASPKATMYPNEKYTFTQYGDFIVTDRSLFNTTPGNYTNESIITVSSDRIYTTITDSTEQQGISIHHLYDGNEKPFPSG